MFVALLVERRRTESLAADSWFVADSAPILSALDIATHLYNEHKGEPTSRLSNHVALDLLDCQDDW